MDTSDRFLTGASFAIAGSRVPLFPSQNPLPYSLTSCTRVLSYATRPVIVLPFFRDITICFILIFSSRRLSVTFDGLVRKDRCCLEIVVDVTKGGGGIHHVVVLEGELNPPPRGESVLSSCYVILRDEESWKEPERSRRKWQGCSGGLG